MISKRLLPFVLLPASLLLAACGAGSAGAEGEIYNLKFASYNVPTAAEAVASKKWAEDVEKATNGRVKIKFFYQEALLKGPETLPGVADGRADMGFIAGAYYPAQLPLSNVAGIPFVTENAEAQGRAFIDLYNNNDALRKEWESQGVHVITWAPVPSNIVALKKPIDSLDDLKGLKVRGYGYVSEALKVAGVSAIGLSQTEVYEALQRGVLEGTSGASLDIAIDRDYQEVAPQFVDINFGNYAVTANVINLNTWRGMPEDIRNAITEVSEDYLDGYLKSLDERELAACDKLRKAGGKVTIFDELETAKWREDAGPAIHEKWVKDVKASNPDADAKAFYESYTSVLKKYEGNSKYESAMKRCAARQ